MSKPQDKPIPVSVRDAATVIVCRKMNDWHTVLMGQRGSTAAFMPDKFVFPGGAVEPGDHDVRLGNAMRPTCLRRMGERCTTDLRSALQAAAIRELWEETGLMLGTPASWQGDVPAAWSGFAEAGSLPAPGAMRFVYRAITPPSKPRRFDARFFLVDAEAISGDLDNLSSASDELSHLQWVRLDAARRFELPFITKRVLDELEASLEGGPVYRPVPFFFVDETGCQFSSIA